MRRSLTVILAAIVMLAAIADAKSSGSKSKSKSSSSKSKSYSYSYSYSYSSPSYSYSYTYYTPATYYTYYDYNRNHYYNSYSVTYTGMALGQMIGTDGQSTYGMIPTNTCPYKCAVNGVCGTESQCSTAATVGLIIGIIFGVIFLGCGIFFCLACCRGIKKAAQAS